MGKFVRVLLAAPAMLLLGSAAPPEAQSQPQLAEISTASQSAAPIRIPAAAPAPVEPPPPPPPPPPPTPQEALEDGVLIVVSIPSQKLFAFKDGKLWDSSDVSTGKPGNDTPTGVFPILQKKVHHRSTLYDDAPMPFMQRLTWDGIALHAGRVPGYPASHGCIRLPEAFAEELYGITRHTSTIVIVSDEPLTSSKEARKLA